MVPMPVVITCITIICIVVLSRCSATAAATAAAETSKAAATGENKANKANLVVVLTDQQRWNTIRLVQEEIGVPEKARINTPNLDRIASQGAYFRNAYTHCAVCGPARASLLTGKSKVHASSFSLFRFLVIHSLISRCFSKPDACYSYKRIND